MYQPDLLTKYCYQSWVYTYIVVFCLNLPSLPKITTLASRAFMMCPLQYKKHKYQWYRVGDCKISSEKLGQSFSIGTEASRQNSKADMIPRRERVLLDRAWCRNRCRIKFCRWNCFCILIPLQPLVTCGNVRVWN